MSRGGGAEFKKKARKQAKGAIDHHFHLLRKKNHHFHLQYFPIPNATPQLPTTISSCRRTSSPLHFHALYAHRHDDYETHKLPCWYSLRQNKHYWSTTMVGVAPTSWKSSTLSSLLPQKKRKTKRKSDCFYFYNYCYSAFPHRTLTPPKKENQIKKITIMANDQKPDPLLPSSITNSVSLPLQVFFFF